MKQRKHVYQRSITTQICMVIIGLVTGTVLLCWFLNTTFLEQYYSFLYGRLYTHDISWLSAMDAGTKEQAHKLFLKVLEEDDRVIGSIWNMELNQNAFCEYVLNNIVALIRNGESNCRFFILLLEHLLYDA